MHIAKIARKDLKHHFNEPRPIVEAFPKRQTDNIDYTSVVRLLSAVNLEHVTKELQHMITERNNLKLL